jgi:hypothetical protein
MTVHDEFMTQGPVKGELYDHHMGFLPSQSIMGGPKQSRQQVRKIVCHEPHSLTETIGT